MLESLLYILYGLLGLVSLFLLYIFRLAQFRTVLIIVAALLLGGGGILAQLSWIESHRDIAVDSVPQSVKDFDYVGSGSCRSCHKRNYQSWYQTYHRTMTQVANTESVLAPFDGRILKRFGTTTKVFQRDGQFYAELTDPAFMQAHQLKHGMLPDDGTAPRAERQIVMTTGSHHLQVYWFREPFTGELWQFPWRYRIKENRWIHIHDSHLQPPEENPLISFRVWSSSCIECHSVSGQPHRNQFSGIYENSKVAELGIACESCHGPGSEHCEANRNPLNRYLAYASGKPQANIVNPKKLDKDISSQVCGACHSHHEFTAPHVAAHLQTTGPQYKAGSNLRDVGEYASVEDESTFGYGKNATRISRFWPDGACRTAGREYNGLLESACHTRGEMTCLSCHSMHRSDPNKQVTKLMDTNEACFQCHQSYRTNLTEHTHHAAGSTGSLCYNCHMPYSSYGLLGGTRSHKIESPRVAPFVKHGRLNACNLCHLDKTLSWTQEHFEDWFDAENVEMPDDERTVAASVLWLLKGDAGQRVTSAWHMGWAPALAASGKGWTVPHLARTFEDPYSAIRFNAWRSVSRIPGFEKLDNRFDSEGTELAKSKDKVLRQWAANKKLHLQRGPQTLVNGGKPDWATIDRLLGQRDESRMVINE